jgi:hypothetical protein
LLGEVAGGLRGLRPLTHPTVLSDPFAPETKEHFEELARFFDKHLAK